MTRISYPALLRVPLTILLVLLVVYLVCSPRIALPGIVGRIDFNAYWSGAYLWAHGQDFSDPTLLFTTEHGMAGSEKPFVMLPWAAPWLNLILWPLTLAPFELAVWWWLWTNLALVSASAILLLRLGSGFGWSPLPALAVAFSFVMTLLSLIAGQVNTLVLFGLTGYLTLRSTRFQWLAGAVLVLATIKPHIAFITLAFVMLEALVARHWRLLGGCALSHLAAAGILFIGNSSWPLSAYQLLAGGVATLRGTPTLSGILTTFLHAAWPQYLALPALAAFLGAWWKFRDRLDFRTWFDLSIVASLFFSPLGWSYDQILLLLPILRVVSWLRDGGLSRASSLSVGIALFLANAFAFYERVLSPSEVAYAWVPLLTVVLYLVAAASRPRFLSSPPPPRSEGYSSALFRVSGDAHSRWE